MKSEKNRSNLMRVLLLILAAVITVGAICLPFVGSFLKIKRQAPFRKPNIWRNGAFYFQSNICINEKSEEIEMIPPLSCCGEI